MIKKTINLPYKVQGKVGFRKSIMKTRATSDKNKSLSDKDDGEDFMPPTPEKMNGILSTNTRFQRRSPIITSANSQSNSRLKLPTNCPGATKDQNERMDLIISALEGYNDEPKKLFLVDTWVYLIKKAKVGSSDERRFKEKERVKRLAHCIIEQIASPNFSSTVGQLLSFSRRNKNGDKFQGFLGLCEEYEKNKCEKTWRDAIGEELIKEEESENEEEEESSYEFVQDEGEKYSGPALTTDELFKLSPGTIFSEYEVEKENAIHTKRQTRGSKKAQQSPFGVSSHSHGTKSKQNLIASNNHKTKKCSVTIKPIAGGSVVNGIMDQERNRGIDNDTYDITTASPLLPPLASLDAEIIENDTPPLTPLSGTDFDNPIPRKRTRFNSRDIERSPSGRSRLRSESTRSDSGENSRNRIVGDTGMIDRYTNGFDYEALINGPVLNGKDMDDLPDLDPPELGRDKENLPKSEQEIIRDYPKPLMAPELKPYMFEEIDEALSRPKKDKIVTAFGLTIMQEQLAVYNKAEWLEDANIDFYLELIKDRNNKEGSEYPKVYIFQSYFYKLLDKRGYESVQGATGKDNIFEYDLVLIPIHSDHHWVLVVVNFREKTMMCYDSMDHNNEKHLRIIIEYVKQEWKEKCKEHKLNSVKKDDANRTKSRSPPLFNMSDPQDFLDEIDELGNDWQITNLGADDIPQQKNGRDCGVFCLQFAEYLSRRQPFDFEQRHTAYFRKRMLYETLKKTLLIS